MASVHYTREQEERVLAAVRSGGVPSCPRCGEPLQRTEVPPREGVPYVRHRVWFVCPPCRRSVVLDRRRLDEAGGR